VVLLSGGKPYPVVRSLVTLVTQYEDNLVADINREAAEHGPGCGRQRGNRVEHELMRDNLASLGREKRVIRRQKVLIMTELRHFDYLVYRRVAHVEPCAGAAGCDTVFATEVGRMAIQKQPACCRRVTVNGHEQLIIETTAGQRITLMDGAVSILIEDTSGNSVRLDNGMMTVSTPGKLTLQAAELEINGSQVVVNAGMLSCSGVVQADTLIANAVSAASYTPGAGNIW